SARGVFGGRNLRKELSFVPIRVAVSVLLRELVAIGVKIDAARGLPVIHANFVGYDEQAHRRGPQSRFAHWGLRGIDKTIARIWKSARQSQYRDYDVWIYSDHGQQATRSYPVEQGESIHTAVHRVLTANLDGPNEMVLRKDTNAADEIYGNLESQNIHLLGSRGLSSWFRRITGPRSNERLVDTEVAAMGPLGFIYVDLEIDPAVHASIAQQLVSDARVPMVLRACENSESGGIQARVWTDDGEFLLPQDKIAVLGEDHPFLDDACDDLIALCHHPYVGSWVISGWRPGKPSISFRIENGAHAGPGEAETHAFALLPGDTPLADLHGNYLRFANLRSAALSLLGEPDSTEEIGPGPFRQERPRFAIAATKSGQERGRRRLRLMTYNIHGCVGMDGKLSVERTARVIAQYQPDVVALQELDVREETHQANLIAEELAMQIHFHPLKQIEQGRFGNAILTHFPLHFVKAEQLLPPVSLRQKIGGAPFNEPRGALWAQLEVDGLTVNIITTHLGLTAKERRAQADILLSDEWLTGPECREPVIVCGDFNAVATQPVYKRMTEVLNDVQTQLQGHVPMRTFAGRYPTVRIDHVFVDSQTAVIKVDVPRTSLTKVASDHLPLIVDLDLSAVAG
ncbi:MAG: endonuclease/exonuclease/phosphatase family protein, partial [Arenicella sp.]|nr:endonuclease/exonuclease/phosphatase family protein [Arenicella sp.]